MNQRQLHSRKSIEPGITFDATGRTAKINLLPIRFRSLVIFICQLMLKRCLATLPNKNARLRQAIN